jgi:hypothetical protein
MITLVVLLFNFPEGNHKKKDMVLTLAQIVFMNILYTAAIKKIVIVN